MNKKKYIVDSENGFMAIKQCIDFLQDIYRKQNSVNDETTEASEKSFEENPKLRMAPKASDYDLIRRDLDKVIELAPDFVYAYYNRANVSVAMNDYRSALTDYDKAIEIDPKLADAYYNRGLVHIYLGNNRLGIQDLSKAGELGLYAAYNVIKRFTERKE